MEQSTTAQAPCSEAASIPQDSEPKTCPASSPAAEEGGRAAEDTAISSWWFASTAIPLLAATTGPLSNVLSIAALVTPWRVALPDNGQLPLGTDDNGVGIKDPHWEIILNALSLACGFTGNFFLLLNFTGRVRYIVALPLSIVFWVLASSILIAIAAAMHVHDPPIGPGEIYSQGFWHAVLASILYLVGSLMLIVNMFGYVRGHYPQRFDLDDDQRTLILQTMLFFFWLAGGAGIYTRLEGWSYSNALYFADVSVLTVGFGDLYPTTNAGRGFLFVFELIGITSLGLVISSISRFVRDISANKIIKSHELHSHKSTLGRTVTNEKELRDRLGLPPPPPPPPLLGQASGGPFSSEADTNTNTPATTATAAATATARFMSVSSGPDRRPGYARANTTNTAHTAHAAHQDSENRYGHIEFVGNTVTYHEHTATVIVGGRGGAARRVAINQTDTDADMDMDGLPWWRRRQRRRRRQQQKKLLLLREEKDRFNAMREIQQETRRFKQYYALAMAVLAFGLLWFMGALVFMFSEERLQGLSYFESLYFGFVALLTIGYGDISPRSNAGKAFFIVWSLIAVPTMTILIQELGATVVAAMNRGTFALADWTVMPKQGLARTFAANIRRWLRSLVQGHKRRLTQHGRRKLEKQQQPQQQQVTAADAEAAARKQRMADLDEATVHQLARQLASAIRTVAHDLGAEPPKRYDFEEWTRFSELIRFTQRRDNNESRNRADALADILADEKDEKDKEQEDEGLTEWDWIGEDSPMLADTTEAQWVLERLCESLNRYTRQQARRQVGAKGTEKAADDGAGRLSESSSTSSSASWPVQTSN
ncbi:Potassium channel [Sporothrix curviconia]|uniref:Potassium channel n=1 Tax=Sporothrix curviconia TaxID=1260050 RepID=A0ABP0CKM3_9PEZI